jgi:hypothetical protein
MAMILGVVSGGQKKPSRYSGGNAKFLCIRKNRKRMIAQRQLIPNS